MNSTSMYQLLAPFAATVLLIIVFYLLGGLSMIAMELIGWGDDDIPNLFFVNIFDFEETNTWVFWIIDVILIIFAEVVISYDE